MEPQTFGFHAPMLYHWASETQRWARFIMECEIQRSEVQFLMGTQNFFFVPYVGPLSSLCWVYTVKKSNQNSSARPLRSVSKKLILMKWYLRSYKILIVHLEYEGLIKVMAFMANG